MTKKCNYIKSGTIQKLGIENFHQRVKCEEEVKKFKKDGLMYNLL